MATTRVRRSLVLGALSGRSSCYGVTQLGPGKPVTPLESRTGTQGDEVMVELVAVAAALGVAGGGGGLAHRSRRRRDSRVEPVEQPRANPAWRVLESDEELRQSIERAIACEQASIAVSQQRAERFASLREQLAPVVAVRSPGEAASRRHVRPPRTEQVLEAS
jgi:hypothetical protein